MCIQFDFLSFSTKKAVVTVQICFFDLGIAHHLMGYTLSFPNATHSLKNKVQSYFCLVGPYSVEAILLR